MLSQDFATLLNVIMSRPKKHQMDQKDLDLDAVYMDEVPESKYYPVKTFLKHTLQVSLPITYF